MQCRSTQLGWRTFTMICLRWILGYMRLEIWCKIGLRLMHATTGLAEAIIRRGGRWRHVTKYVYQKLLKSNNARSIYSWKCRQSFFETQSIWHMMGTSPVSMFSNKDTYCQKVQFRLIDWVAVVHPTRHKTGHFGDVSPSQSLGLVWKKH